MLPNQFITDFNVLNYSQRAINISIICLVQKVPTFPNVNTMMHIHQFRQFIIFWSLNECISSLNGPIRTIIAANEAKLFKRRRPLSSASQ